MKSDILKQENGFTLAEVMVAFVILLLASQLLISGHAAARKMELRANELSCAADLLQENLSDDSKCIPGTIKMQINEDIEMVSEGWLYRYENSSENDIVIEAIRVKERN